uniref:Retrotransposon Copia-like N-terminal domain-containing protein n=1 Tax=Chenopodium quinoa TaxID=63459 RepID=A0A803N1T8_CHEQI
MPENESSDSLMNYQDPLFLSHYDNHASSLTLMLYDGSNFMIWSRNVKLALGAKNKKAFIEGKIPIPASGHKDYNKWERHDEVVGGLSLVQTSKQLWDELSERYSESNIPLLYQLKKDLRKLDMYKKMLSMVETNRVIQFLMGLNRGYHNVRENILNMDPLPSVNKAFHMVQQTGKQKKVSEMDSPLDEEEYDTGSGSMSKLDAGMISAVVKEDPTNGESLAFGEVTNDLYKFTLSKHLRSKSSTRRTVLTTSLKSSGDKKVPRKFKNFEVDLPSNTTDHDDQSPSFSAHKLTESEFYDSSDFIISLNNVMKVVKPTNYSQASANKEWKEAMEEELSALDSNITWKFSDLPTNKKALDSKWVYKVKFDRNGKVVRLKERLVASGDK